MHNNPAGVIDDWDSEQWRQVAGFPGYWISDSGRVLNIRIKRTLSFFSNNYGFFVTLRRDNRSYSRSIRALRTVAFPERTFDDRFTDASAARFGRTEKELYRDALGKFRWRVPNPVLEDDNSVS